ncbi:UNVERIFIED_CONTAM: hypothetical protein FKN15_017057 [Acipenser sinensis]
MGIGRGHSVLLCDLRGAAVHSVLARECPVQHLVVPGPGHAIAGRKTLPVFPEARDMEAPPRLLSRHVGKPLRVERNEKPSAEEVDAMHERYLEELCKLFEEHKAKYGVPEDKHLRFV